MTSLTTEPTGDAALTGLEVLSKKHRDQYFRSVRDGEQMGWGYYFPNLLTQNKPGKSVMYFLEDNGSVCIFRWTKKEDASRLDLYVPPVPYQPDVLNRCLERANTFNSDLSAQIIRVDAREAELMGSDGSLRVRPRREQYLFKPNVYQKLSGKPFYTIRRNVGFVEKQGDVETMPFLPKHADICLDLLERWKKHHREAHGTAGGAGISKRTITLATDPDQTDIRGEVVFLDGNLVAFAFGGEIRPGLACSFDRKCDTSIRGLSYYHFRSFLQRLGDFDLVNDGSDTGRGGLKQLKQSFRPVKMHTEYRVGQRVARSLHSAPTLGESARSSRADKTRHFPEEEQSAWRCVGLMCNFKKPTNPTRFLSPSLYNRAIILGEELAKHGVGLFLYSPNEVVKNEPTVSGYLVKGSSFRATKRSIPRINANWTYGTRKLIDRGMGYRSFKRWVRENEVEVYVPYEFSELVSNKCDAYSVVKVFDEKLYPRTEDFAGTEDQIKDFLAHSRLVFIKPRGGNKGNKIFVLRSDGESYSMRFYNKGVCRVLEPITISAVLTIMEIASTDQNFCIQEGIDSLRINGAVSDIRVVLVNDGKAWHSILETRMAPVGSDLSNVYQGGSIHETVELLKEELGANRSQSLLRRIEEVSKAVAIHLDSFFPGQIMELGLDLIVDPDLGIHLVEVNAKPGVSGVASELRLSEWKPDQDDYFEQTVRTQVRHLAGFLLSKMKCAQLS